jgi:hypothetical protein
MANPTGKGGFKRGLSGNPGGRPAVSVELRALARERTPEAMKVLTDIMMDPKAPAAARVAACRELFELALKPAELHLVRFAESLEEIIGDARRGLDLGVNRSLLTGTPLCPCMGWVP